MTVSGTSVSWASGTKFSGVTAGSPIVIAGTLCSVASVQSPILLTLTSPAASTGGAYLAPRGGRDGNMIQLYTLATSPATTSFDSSQIQFTGGSSAVTWNVSLDFTTLGIDSIRQCWLTFAPSLTNGAAFTAAEWLATFSNWQLSVANGFEFANVLQVAGPGSVRIEETDSACSFTGAWTQESGFYSKYFAKAASVVNDSITVAYTCQFTHNLYIGTSLYSDRGVAGITLLTDDTGDTETLLDCRLTTASAIVTRRLIRSSVAAGTHTVVIRVQQAGVVYFDFLEAAVLSDVPDALAPRPKISVALDFDTDQTYKVSPSRLLWILNQLGYAGPINEYLGVFWWNQRIASGGTLSTAEVTFACTFAAGDSIILTFNPPGGAQLGKSVFPTDTPATIANHFAAFINSSLVGAWASASAGVLTIHGAFLQGSAYNLALSVQVVSIAGTGYDQSGPAGGWYLSAMDYRRHRDSPHQPRRT